MLEVVKYMKKLLKFVAIIIFAGFLNYGNNIIAMKKNFSLEVEEKDVKEKKSKGKKSLAVKKVGGFFVSTGKILGEFFLNGAKDLAIGPKLSRCIDKNDVNSFKQLVKNFKVDCSKIYYSESNIEFQNGIDYEEFHLLHYCCKNIDEDNYEKMFKIIKSIVVNGGNKDINKPICFYDKLERVYRIETPFLMACEFGDYALVNFLYENGADISSYYVDVVDRVKYRSLRPFEAVIFGNSEFKVAIVEFFLENGLKVNKNITESIEKARKKNKDILFCEIIFNDYAFTKIEKIIDKILLFENLNGTRNMNKFFFGLDSDEQKLFLKRYQYFKNFIELFEANKKFFTKELFNQTRENEKNKKFLDCKIIFS